MCYDYKHDGQLQYHCPETVHYRGLQTTAASSKHASHLPCQVCVWAFTICLRKIDMCRYCKCGRQHITALHGISQHFTAYHSTSRHLTAPHSISQHFTADHSTSQHTVLARSLGLPINFWGLAQYSGAARLCIFKPAASPMKTREISFLQRTRASKQIFR